MKVIEKEYNFKYMFEPLVSNVPVTVIVLRFAR